MWRKRTNRRGNTCMPVSAREGLDGATIAAPEESGRGQPCSNTTACEDDHSSRGHRLGEPTSTSEHSEGAKRPGGSRGRCCSNASDCDSEDSCEWQLLGGRTFGFESAFGSGIHKHLIWRRSKLVEPDSIGAIVV